MKPIFLNSLLIILTLMFIYSCDTKSNKNNSIQKENELLKDTIPNNSANKRIIRLKKFYTLYISEMSKDEINLRKVDSLKTSACSIGFLDYLNEEALDYDPFINAQDCNISWLEDLTINESNKDKNKYLVCFNKSISDSICVKIELKLENGEYKINNIE